MNFTKIGLALAVSAAAASANAAWEYGNNTGVEGELILNVWNDTTKTSLSVDLGESVKTSLDLAIGSSFAIDPTAWAHVGGNAAADAGQLTFNVAGANIQQAIFQTSLDSSDMTVYTTQAVTPTPTAGFAAMTGAGGPFETLRNKLESPAATIVSGTDDPTITLAGDLDYTGFLPVWGDQQNSLQGVLGTASSSVAVGDSMYAYALQLSGTTFTVDTVESAGFWTVSYDGNSAQLEYVPVPAAVWLFASGLLGLAGVSRRKKKA